MVTEILRNQAPDLKEKADEIGTIVFDEAHYIGDDERGAVWENSIISAAKSNIQTLCLSATLGNGEEFSGWIQSLNPKRNVTRVEANLSDRLVPLNYRIYKPEQSGGEFLPVVIGQIDLTTIDENNLSDRQKRALSEIYTSENDKNEFYELSDNEYISTLRNLKIKTKGDENFFYEYQFPDILKEAYPKLDKHQAQKITELLLEDKHIARHKVPPLEKNDYASLVKDLDKEDMTPALIFKLSQKGCDKIKDELAGSGLDLTTSDEKEQIKGIVDKYLEENASLGDDFDEYALLKGFAVHHAGKLPDYQKLVEELFSKKLIKVVSATSTLSAGINMPVRTVVMSDVSYLKHNPKTGMNEKTPLTPSDFHQMAGRAGRRGIDSVGYVVLYNLNSKNKNYQQKNQNAKLINNLKYAYDLIESEPNKLTSSFKPEPCMVSQYYYENDSDENLEEFIGDSFKVYLAKNREGQTKTLVHSFEKYTNILKNLGFIKKDGNKTSLTPKGELLRISSGANPIMLSSLIYEQKLKNLSPEQLAQTAGYIASSDNQKEDKKLEEIIEGKLAFALKKDPDKNEQIKEFASIRNNYQIKESKVSNAMINNGFDPDELEFSDSFGGLCPYLFAHLNKANSDSNANFNFMINNALKAVPFEDRKDSTYSNSARIEFNRKSTSGKIYKTIAQSICVLEQIERICDYALSNEEKFTNQKYYLELKQNTSEALKLIKKEPFIQEAQ